MGNRRLVVAIMIASLLLPETLPATAASSTPLAGLHELVGTWKCTYRAGAIRLPYDATYAYDLDGHLLRQIASWAGGGDEELLAYDAQHAAWNVVVVDDHGNATVMRGAGKDPKHFAYRSAYPDSSIAVKFDRISATKYTLHGTVRAGGKTIVSVDTCLR